jgi:16S rRNA processing protein RimM
MDKKVLVGKILRPRGLSGELKVDILTNKTTVFSTVKKVYIDDKEYTVTAGSIQGNYAYLNLLGVNKIEFAEKFRNREIFINAGDIKLNENEILSVDIIGYTVLNQKGEKIGVLRGVENYGGGDFFEIAIPVVGIVQIPNEDEFITETDTVRKTITLTDNALQSETIL